MANKGCEDLPDECWELILSKLHHRSHSLLEPPSLSCKRFLAITNALRTRLSILPQTTIPLSSTLLPRFPNLSSIHLHSFRAGEHLCRLITDIAASGLNLNTLDFTGSDGLHLDSWRLLGSSMNNIRVLNCSSLRTLRDVELVVIADSMPRLEDLDISYPGNGYGLDPELQGRSLSEVGVTDSGIEAMSWKLKRLRKICISGNYFITDKSLIALSTNCVYLRVISARNCVFLTLVGIEFVLLNCTSLSELTVNKIDFGQLDDGSIRCARNLSTLNIYDSVVSNECLNLLAKAGVPLKKFTLSYFFSLGFTFSGISSVLNEYRFLECISLEGINFLTDETMISLSQCLSSLVTISLDRCCNLTESTLFMLAKDCPSLENIIMARTNVGGGGEKATNFVKNPRIKSLNLENNRNLSDECLAKLASVCPGLEVLLVSYCKGITERGIADFLKSGSSRLRSLWINNCGGIKSIGNGFELAKLDFIGAARSGINDDGLVVVGNRCHGLLDLDLDGCLGVTTVGLKEVLTNCERLRKINLNGCLNVCMETVDWMVFSRSSPRKITVSHSYLPSESQRQLFLLHGCLVLSE